MASLFSEIKNSLFETNKVLSIQVDIQAGNISLFGLILKKQNEKIEIINSIDNLESEEWKSLPIILTLSGKGILQKRSDQSTEKVKLRNVFPAIKEEEFYCVYAPLTTGCNVCIIRNETIDSILNQLNIRRTQIVDISLESSVLSSYSDTSFELPDIIGGYKFTYENNNVSSFIKTETKGLNFIFGESLNAKFHFAFISGVAFFLKLNISGNDVWNMNKKEWKSKKIFQTTLAGLLGFLLVFFLVNLFVNNSLLSSFNEVSSEATKVEDLVNEKERIRNEIELKEDFINKLKLSQNAQFANLAEEIGISVPQNIQLTSIKFNPLKKSVRKKKEIIFDSGIVIIEGVSAKSIYYHKWAKALKSFNWVKKVELVAYEENRDKIGEFIIEIEY